ncbi:WD40-repeat-containing domain protein [Phakopsora pachyrhizi]|uniref:WD40-repeat-containing domain protein n=1 Tax=Phakopsora pachyrhizi TaxID=170000 RepID=A0AAV0BI31_PHAPC|nr:WD40-repeat-containing domain protein [Phakopsora pachyrhizi]
MMKKRSSVLKRPVGNAKRARVESAERSVRLIENPAASGTSKNPTEEDPISYKTRLKSNTSPELSNRSTNRNLNQPSKPGGAIRSKPHTLRPLPEPDLINIVFGTYEHILYGIQLKFSDPSSENSQPSLSTLFHFLAHSASLNVLAISPYPSDPKLVSSSTDSPITLWSLSRRKCLGTLSSAALPNDSGGAAKEPGVRTAQFDSSFKILVVGDEAGGITIYRTRDWAIVKRLNSSSSLGNARLNDTAIEPRKGRLMLSVGKDRCLRMWDLSNSSNQRSNSSNRPMASMRLGIEAEKVSWSQTGKRSMNPLLTFTSPRGRIHEAKFFLSVDQPSQEFLALACEDSVCRIFSLRELPADAGSTPECVMELIGHLNRVKSVDVVSLSSQLYAITISSDGFCNVYRLSGLSQLSSLTDSKPLQVEPLTKYDTGGCRLTCLASAVGVDSTRGEKEQKGERGSDEESTDDDSHVGEDDTQPESALALGVGEDLDASGKPIDLSDLSQSESEVDVSDVS